MGAYKDGLLRAARIVALFAFISLASATRAAEALTFFTNVADRLLKSHLDLSVRRIPVAPTNAYDLEVHRLLQVAANLYDATQTNWYPSVFRPIVGADPLVPGGLAVTNFVYDSDEASIGDWLARHGEYGAPIIIGAKKGIPNFNEFVMQTTVLAARKLELRRPNTNSPPTETNQMYILGISNVLAVEAWNSYTQACCIDNVTLTVGMITALTITNDNGLYFETNWASPNLITIAPNAWSGFAPREFRGGFQVPLYTNVVLLTDSAYRPVPPRFDNATQTFERGLGYTVPQWTATLSNRVAYTLSSRGRIFDFAFLRNLTNAIDLTAQMLNSSPLTSEPGFVRSCWQTNRIGGFGTFMTPTEGILQQLRIGLGEDFVSVADWFSYNFGSRVIVDINAEIDLFRNFSNCHRSIT